MKIETENSDGYYYLKPDDLIQEGDEWTDSLKKGAAERFGWAEWDRCVGSVGGALNESHLWGDKPGSQASPRGLRVRRKLS
jgi:hypothetical protein